MNTATSPSKKDEVVNIFLNLLKHLRGRRFYHPVSRPTRVVLVLREGTDRRALVFGIWWVSLRPPWLKPSVRCDK